MGCQPLAKERTTVLGFCFFGFSLLLFAFGFALGFAFGSAPSLLLFAPPAPLGARVRQRKGEKAPLSEHSEFGRRPFARGARGTGGSMPARVGRRGSTSRCALALRAGCAVRSASLCSGYVCRDKSIPPRAEAFDFAFFALHQRTKDEGASLLQARDNRCPSGVGSRRSPGRRLSIGLLKQRGNQQLARSFSIPAEAALEKV